ncbi:MULTISPECIES: F0F1 ATP synthase subunit alpha [Acetobacter]|uniref:ATP synthase subunit alpha n=2 Tax=Acetobacter TaxID=434 RepID=A0A401WUF0_ACEPA|nr:MULTISPECIES: F0F1 ATP synthase subunit alpha [Acetobacter]MCP1243793.1 F0F1 ATP synthase subunit alpha [Acetobacter lambici]MCP1259813.1 F0F1 ATP synthase subunit alpha [Acetobacter lambici]NHO58021.1 F0F1 ATP synthase subunit alpha [Acetobacter lambici]GCD52942.1 ATP synthase F1 subunit alpha [Acetobacter pasteurianus NBRC 3188]
MSESETQDDDKAWLVRVRSKLSNIAIAPQTERTGRVEEIGDGVALISGLPDARLDELLCFGEDCYGFAHSLEEGRIGCVLLDDAKIEAGAPVYGTSEVVSVPVGPTLLGRVVDPLGRPLDGKGEILSEERLPVERPAPEIIDRDLVVQPVQTGTLVIDALFPIGRGQRELIVGDRATGKTTVATDTILAQKDNDIICVYVAIDQKTSSVQRVIDAIRKRGNPDRCIIVVARPSQSPGLRWIAPFAAFSMAEYFRDKGQHAIVVMDDLSKHADTHREISLLTGRAPGREAYPGDIFYVHARLLERAAKLSPEKGGGSLTALPVAETEAGNLSAYIPTNLISITDGQIVLDRKLFDQGQKPAVDVGVSVSRVGGATQAPALRDVVSSLRLDYAQYTELETFTRFGGLPDAHVRQQLLRGIRIRSVLRQGPQAPLNLVQEVALVAAAQNGLFDAYPVCLINTMRESLGTHLCEALPDLAKAIADGQSLSTAEKTKFLAVLKNYIVNHVAAHTPA